MDASYYAVQFDTARELVANNNPEGATGLYAIYNSLSSSSDLDQKHQKKFSESKLHYLYPEITVCVYLVFFTKRMNITYKNKTISQIDAYLKIQDFKQQTFKEISLVLQVLLPEQNIEWRFEHK